ncbi:MAG: hypothetical protein P1P85_04015 [Patescibacteria group bacterium]|nr:hypothetical protein [Patescibacteria group bacterium]
MELLLLFISSKQSKGIRFEGWESLPQKLSLFKYIEESNYGDHWPICENRIINFSLQEGLLYMYRFKYHGSVAMISITITKKGENEVEKIIKLLEK